MIKIKDDYDEIFWFRMIMMKIKDECFDEENECSRSLIILG
jgi:hypothetical protein